MQSDVAAEQALTEEETYDAIPFPEEPRFWSSPAYIAASARLFGLETPPVERARILEIGCASGSNIIPMAARHPDAQFVGIDISSRQIAAAQKHANEIGLTNISFLHFNFDADPHVLGTFDYVIAHGIYSWISPTMQTALWKFCTQTLNDDGLLYLSYNTLPYWHLKQPVRDLLCFHAKNQTDNLEKLQESIDFAHDVAEHAPGIYGQLFRDEIAYIDEQNIRYLAHDHFELENHPVYVKDIFAEAESFGFRYVSEATATYSSLRLLKRNVAAAIERYSGDDRTLREQYIDFYTGRAFRRSLFAKSAHAKHVPLDIIPEQIDDLHIVFADLPPSVNFAEPTRSLYYFDDTYFDTPADAQADPLRVFAEVAIGQMAQTLPSLPRSIAVREIFEMFASATQNNPAALSTVRSAILEFFYQRKVAFSAVPLSWDFDRERPRAQRMIISDAAHGRTSTVSVLHDEIYLRGENVRRLLSLLDGTRSRNELATELLSLVQSGSIKIVSPDEQALSPDQLPVTVVRFLDEMLMKFASLRILTK